MTTENQIYAKFIGNYINWPELKFCKDLYSYNGVVSSEKLEKEVGDYIQFLDKETQKATVDKDGYYRRELRCNPLLLAWRCMAEKLREREKEIVNLQKAYTQKAEKLEYYQSRYNAILDNLNK